MQLVWYRLVVDEAQMVGPMSASGQMVERMRAVHRWCVTGTPLTSHGMQDVRGLLHMLQHQHFSSQAIWSALVGAPLREGEGGGGCGEATRATQGVQECNCPVGWA